MSRKDGWQNNELEAIRAIARSRRTDDLAALCSDMQLIAARCSDSERAAIYLLDREKRELVMATTPHGYDGALAHAYNRVPLDAPLMGEAIRSLTPSIASAALLPEPLAALTGAAGFVEFAIVPLHADGTLTGTLNLARTRAVPYESEVVELVSALGDLISIQIERARLYIDEKERGRHLSRLNDDLRRSYEELALAQTELVRKERLASVGELAALVAHEVRNPLAVIFNVISQLQKRIHGNTRENAQLIPILHEEATRLDRIVRNFLEFGRPASPKFTLIKLRALVETAVELTTRALPPTKIEWHIEVAPEAASLDGDEDLLCQVLVNLLTNAAEAQSLRGNVWIKISTCRQDGHDRILLAIEDEGVGIAPEFMGRVFEPFFTTKASGTGLGLTIVQHTVHAHAGKVSVLPRKGGGTVVTVTLPLHLQVWSPERSHA